MQAGVAVGDAENLGRCPEYGVVEPMTGIEPAFSAWEVFSTFEQVCDVALRPVDTNRLSAG